jgi:hypothetical protein
MVRRDAVDLFAMVPNVQRCGASTVERFLLAPRG